ncbi:Chaperone protein dnaJ 15 [Acorus gramineus]|uniref:Chaperone protein dnaJ 15 n=1 Tax=Acorus gramineus TaxID=55184 RepID=A0AAV9BYD2_ACOGR|nr:Chaperone protein dnaJ 15 [Acorus gramineus]
MEDAWLRLRSRARWALTGTRGAFGRARDRTTPYFPVARDGAVGLGRWLVVAVMVRWRDCAARGVGSLVRFGPVALFLVMWSCLLSLTSMSCLVYVLLVLGAAGATIHYLGYTPGLFIVGLFAILILWMYGNFWITGTLFVVAGYLFSLNHARPLILMATTYAVYCVKAHVGWVGVFLSINLSFFSNDLLNHFMERYDGVSEERHSEEPMKSESFVEDFSRDCGSSPSTEAENTSSSESFCNTSSVPNIVNVQNNTSGNKVVKDDSSSLDEMKRIMDSKNHYEALGFLQENNIDVTVLRKEYYKKAMLLHPDKNMGNPLASESFKRLQCAYEILSDPIKKRNYDEQLRKEESKILSRNSSSSSQQDGLGYRSDESRIIECTKCGNSHIWICTKRTRANARWCQDCCQFHHATDGDGWVEIGSSSGFSALPRAFVCAEKMIFDVSEWVICQDMTCKLNAHRPTFKVSRVSLGENTQRSGASRFAWELKAQMMEEEKEDNSEVWFQQLIASGYYFSDATKHRRKSWSPFKLTQMKSYKHRWRSP